MIILAILGYISCVLNPKHKDCYVPLLLGSKHNFIACLKHLGLIMVVNLPLYVLSLITRVSYSKLLVRPRPNKMGLLNGNTVISSMLVELYGFKPIYHNIFGGKAYKQHVI